MRQTFELPKNLEAERAILGSILIDNNLIDVCVPVLAVDDFSTQAHRIIYRALIEHRESPADLITLTEHLRKSGQLEHAGGAGYLASLLDGIPRIKNVENYLKIVKDKSRLRKLMFSCEAVLERAATAQYSSDEIIDFAESQIFSLQADRAKQNVVSAFDLVTQSAQMIENIIDGQENQNAMRTGFAQLDRLLGGLQPNELIILAARPSAGKSAFGLNLCENLSIFRKIPTAFFSLEMTRESLLLRLISSLARINGQKFRTAQITKREATRITEALSKIAESPIFFDDSPTINEIEIASKARRLRREHGIRLIVIDYLQLIQPFQSNERMNRNEQVGAVARAMKSMAKELHIPILLLSQLSRSPAKEKRRPELSDLRDSGEIEQHADTVIFLHVEKHGEGKEADEMEVIVGKQRNGPQGSVPFVFFRDRTRFEEAARDNHFAQAN